MPFYLKDRNIIPQVADLKSALIVPCRFCPAASLAVRKNKPYIELFRRFLRTEAYEDFIDALKHRLQEEGLRTAVFDSQMPHNYVACMWTAARRKRLAERAAQFEAIVVLGCDAMVDAVRDAIESVDCQVIQGMEIEGLMNILPTYRLPFNVSLKLNGLTPTKLETSSEQTKAPERVLV